MPSSCKVCEQDRCGACPVAKFGRPVPLPEAAEALDVYRMINRQLIYDFPMMLPVVFDVMGIETTRDGARRLLHRLCFIHDFLAKAQKDKED